MATKQQVRALREKIEKALAQNCKDWLPCLNPLCPKCVKAFGREYLEELQRRESN